MTLDAAGLREEHGRVAAHGCTGRSGVASGLRHSQAGQTLTASSGSWSGYWWQRCDSNRNHRSNLNALPVRGIALPDRLVVDRVTFSPRKVTSRAQPLAARFHLREIASGRPVSGAP